MSSHVESGKMVVAFVAVFVLAFVSVLAPAPDPAMQALEL